MNDLSLHRVLIKPIYTEKSVTATEKNQVFIFKVDIKSNKKIIKYAIEKIFNVVVLKVRTLTIYVSTYARVLL